MNFMHSFSFRTILYGQVLMDSKVICPFFSSRTILAVDILFLGKVRQA